MRRVWGLLARVVPAVAFLLTATTAAGAEPPSIERVRELGAEADFEASARLARERLASGALDRAEAAETYLELGIVNIALGNGAAGAAALRRALKLEPALTLPDTVGPNVRDVFAEAKKQAPLEPLAVSVALSAGVRELGISARVSGDSERIVRRLVVEGEGLRRTFDLGPEELRKTERVELGTARCVTLVATVQDEFGNRLWPAISTARVCATEEAAAAPGEVAPGKQPGGSPASPSSGERPIPASVWISGSVTVGLIGITTVLGITYLDRRSDYEETRETDPDSRDLEQMHQSADRMGDMATVAGLTAGAAAITTAVLYLTRPRAEGAHAARVQVGLSPVSVLISGKF
jgi:hypothetical protein